MNLSDIITKCYILALIIRDDGERLLLGDGIYEFKSSLQHFAPNIYQNDIVELQGTDGQLLAGQVRRSATQAFDGYIADGTITKTTTEQNRRRFLAFFRKKHHYKVVYIMPDGTAVQRDRGYIVDAPAVQELYQLFPEYHIGLNFEDPNYYEYEEDSEGDEIYAHIQAIAITRELQAGLVWDALGAVSDDIAWSDYTTKNTTDGYAQITDAIATAPLSLTHLYGNATQKTLNGWSLLNFASNLASSPSSGLTVSADQDGTIKWSGTASGSWAHITNMFSVNLPAGTYTFSIDHTFNHRIYISYKLSNDSTGYWIIEPNNKKTTIATSLGVISVQLDISGLTASQNYNESVKAMFEAGSTAHDYEPYCGGIPSPNPDFPQEIKTVTGAQTVKITGKNLCYSANRVSNTTLEFFADCATIKSPNVALSFITDFTTSGNASVYSFVDGVDLHTTVGLIATTAGQRSATTLDLTAIMSQIKDGTTLRLMVYRGGSTFTTVSDAQIELGSTATPYEPYQGQSQEINLGTLELAKIGTYQDYIWNDDGTWKIHKEVGKVVLDGTEWWSGGASTGSPTMLYSYTSAIDSTGKWDEKVALSNNYTVIDTKIATAYVTDSPVMSSFVSIASELYFLRFMTPLTVASSIANFKTWLSTHPTTVYYALATPTDTEITDSELIEQLNHIYSLYQGQNNLWLIPSAGAQGEMTVRYAIGYSDIGSGYHWNEEQGASSNIVTNDGIDSVRPLWIINGPATNPTLTNSTTGQTITWNGTVPADATLTIDMDRQTATLNGANVFAQLEGDWIELAVGPNKLQYSASGGATEDSTLEWNGVIG